MADLLRPVSIFDQPNPDFDCSISQEVMIFPVTTRCNHVFDHFSIVQWTHTNPACPICRDPSQPLTPSADKDLAVQNFVLSELQKDPSPLEGNRHLHYYLITHPQLRQDPAISQYLGTHAQVNQTIDSLSLAARKIEWLRTDVELEAGQVPSYVTVYLMKKGQQAGPEIALRQLVERILNQPEIPEQEVAGLSAQIKQEANRFLHPPAPEDIGGIPLRAVRQDRFVLLVDNGIFCPIYEYFFGVHLLDRDPADPFFVEFQNRLDFALMAKDIFGLMYVVLFIAGCIFADEMVFAAIVFQILAVVFSIYAAKIQRDCYEAHRDRNLPV